MAAAACGGDDGNDGWRKKLPHLDFEGKDTSFEYVSGAESDEESDDNDQNSKKKSLRIRISDKLSRKKEGTTSRPLVIGPERRKLRSDPTLELNAGNVEKFKDIISSSGDSKERLLTVKDFIDDEAQEVGYSRGSKKPKDKSERKSSSINKKRRLTVNDFIDDEAEEVGRSRGSKKPKDKSERKSSSINKKDDGDKGIFKPKKSPK